MASENLSRLDRVFGPAAGASADKRSAAIQQRTVEADEAIITGEPLTISSTAEPLSRLDRVFGVPTAVPQAPTAVAQPRPQAIPVGNDPQQSAGKKPWYQFIIDAQQGEIAAGQGAVELAANPKFREDVGIALSNTPQAFAGGAAALLQGNNPEDMRRDVGKTRWQDDEIAKARKNAKDAEENGGEEEYSKTLGITRAKIRNLPQNAAFSIINMGLGLAAGIPAAFATTPAGGYAAGAIASGVGAYRMDTNGFLNDIRDKLDYGSVMARGITLSDDEWAGIAKKYEGAVREHGLWEALPEALGNVVGAKVGGIIFKEASLGLKGLLKSSAAVAGGFGVELGTETITQTGQHNVEVDIGLSNKPKRSFASIDDLATSAKEVLPDVLLLTGLMGGGARVAGTANRIYNNSDFAQNRAFANALTQDVDAMLASTKGPVKAPPSRIDPTIGTAIDPKVAADDPEKMVGPTGDPFSAEQRAEFGAMLKRMEFINASPKDKKGLIAPKLQKEFDAIVKRMDQIEANPANPPRKEPTLVEAPPTAPAAVAPAAQAEPVFTAPELAQLPVPDKRVDPTWTDAPNPLDQRLNKNTTTGLAQTDQSILEARPFNELKRRDAGVQQVAGSRVDPLLDDATLMKQQQGTAVGVAEPAFSADQQQGVAQPVSLGGTAKTDEKGKPLEQQMQQINMNPAGEIDSNELLAQLAEVDRQNGVTNQQLSTAPVPKTLQAAVQGMATELGLPEGETLQVTEVADDKRLNTFGKALNSAFGVNVHWVDFGEGGMTTSTGQNMGGFNGYRQGDTILVDPKNADLMDTTWHELTHTLETKHPEVYADLRDTILRTVDPAMKTALYDALNKRRVAEVGKPMTASQLESELVAVTVGGQASNPEYLGQLFDSFKDKTLAQQFKEILSEILNKLSRALQGPTYIKERQKINQTRDAITKAFVLYQEREGAKSRAANATNETDATNATASTAVMPEALAVKVAASKLSSNLSNQVQTDVDEKRQGQEGDQQQRGGIDQGVQSPQQDQQQPTGQPNSGPEASAEQAKPVGQFSRIAPPVADKDGIVRVNGREYPERTESYTPDGTKAYLKRAVDTGPRPKSLPLEPERFFKYNYLTRLVNTSDIDSTKTDAENIKGSENAPKRFMAAYDGVTDRRDAIAIQDMGNGRFKVIDGNGTLSAFKSYGWNQIPANVFKDEASFKEFEARQAEAPKYSAYMLSNQNRRELQVNFPPSHGRLVLDHITANPNDPARPTKVEIVGLSDNDGIQALVAIVDGKRYRDDLDANGKPEPYHITLSVSKTASSGDAGKMINTYGYDDITPFVLNLPYGADYKQINRKQDVLDRLTDKDQNQPVATNEYIKYPDIFRAVVATEDVLKKAPAVKKAYDAAGEKFAKETGTKYKAGPIKKFPKSFAKIWYDYNLDASKLKDAVRATITIEFPDQVQGVIDAVLASYPNSTLKHNRWNPDPAIANVHPSGYRDVMFNMSFGGMPVELQMNLPEMIAAKAIGHKLYDKAVKLTQEMEKSSTSNERAEVLRNQIADLNAQQAVIYGDAFKAIQDRAASQAATSLRNSASDITSPSSSAVNRLYDQGGSSRTVEKNIQQRQVNPEIVTGMPLATSRNIVPSGNESGNRTIDASPVTIPDSNIPQQEGLGQASRKLKVVPKEQPNPLLGIVDVAEAQGRISRRLARKQGVGAPHNQMVEFQDGNRKFLAGRITPVDWQGRVTRLLTQAEVQDSRTWYRQLDEALRPIFGDKTPVYALAWLLSQKRASPTKGFTDVLRAADMAEGKQLVKIAGLNQQALIDVLQGKVPAEGVGAKLMDFLDSELGRSTRTFVRDDPRGRQPAAIDVWAQRDIGFVDETVLEYVRKKFGDDAANSLTVDKTTSGEAQYEYGIDLYNDVVDHLNGTNYEGGGWTAREVQAVGWVTMQREMGVEAEFVRDIIGGNTRRISIGLAAGSDSILADKLAGKEIPVEVAQREISYLAGIAGINITQNVAGAGAYLEWIEGAIQIDAVASPEAVADFMDMVGYAFQQTEVINTRPLASGKNMVIDVMSPSLNTVEAATKFFSKFLADAPKKNGEHLAPGFQQITVNGVSGIRLLNMKSDLNPATNWRQTELVSLYAAISGAAAASGIELSDVATSQVALTSTKNDWKEFPDGKNYTDSLSDRGRVREVELLKRRYAPSRLDVAGDGTISWREGPASEAADAGATDAGPAERPNLEEAGQFSRRDVELAANGDPRAPPLFGISQTPAVLTAVGAPRQLLVMDSKNVAKVVNPQLVGKNTEEAVRKNASGQWVSVQPRIPLTVDELRKVPAMIADPVAVFNSAGANRRQGYKVLLDLVKGGFPVVAIIHPDVRFGPDVASELVTVYPANEQTTLNELNSDLKKDGQLLYFNRGKALALNGQVGNRLSSVLKAAGGAKVPGQVPNRAFTPLPSSNFARALGQGGVGNRFTLPERTFAEKTANLLSNEMSRVTAVQNAVVEQGGTVTDKTRIEDVVHRMYGKAGNRMDAFRKTFVQPLIERAAKANVNLDDVAMYLYANHALERNDYIRSINPAFPDGGSGMADADAKQILKDMRSKGADFAKLKNVADQLQAVGLMTQQALKDGGLVDQAHLDEWNQRYTNYVPLKGFEQIDENGQTGNGRFDPRNPFFKRAMGRGRRAGQIVENILLDHEEAIVAAEKNKVRQAFLKFALDNKDNALWHVNPVGSQARFDKNTSLVSYATVMDEGKDTIGVRYNGKPYSIKVTDAAMLDDLVMGGILPSNEGIRQLFNAWSTVNRTLAKLWTALSPAFVLTNAQRDLEFAIAKSAVEAGGKQTVDVVKDFIPAAYAIMRAERNGNWGANSELKKYYDMYKADGGKTGFMDLKTLDERQREVVSAFKNAQASGTNPLTYHRLALRYIQSAEDFIMDINGGIENAARVAAYKSAIESGKPRTEAATIAKNLTVNFNRRGKLSPFLSSFYLFFNPAVQGAVATKNLIFSKKGAALGASLAAIGYMVASMSAGALGDDGEPFWEKDANRQSKLKSLLFFGPNGEQYTIPLAYGLGFFVNLGYAMRDLQSGAEPLKVAKFMRDSFFVHFSPLGSMENFANFMLPTLADPAVVLMAGKREDGSPLLPSDIDETKPESEKYWTNTRDTAIQRFTTWVNEATGGSKAVSGLIDVSPEKVKYVTTFATGGAGSFIRDTLTSIDLMMNVGPNAPVEKNTVPILKQFYKTNTGQMDQRAFYDNVVTTQQARAELKAADNVKGEMPEGMRKRLESGKVEAYSDIEGMHRSAVKQLSNIRKRELEVIDNPDMSKAEKYQVRKGLDEERRQVEVEFNRNFYGVRKNVGSFTPWTK